MKKSIFRTVVISLLATVIAGAPALVLAQDAPKAKTGAEKKEEPKAEKKRGLPPLRGKVGAIDKTAMTLTVGEHTVAITSDTRISKAGKPATLGDGVVGEEVTVSYRKGDDGKLSATTVRFGPRPEGEGKKAEPKKEKKE